jgi:hypothetical protein
MLASKRLYRERKQFTVAMRFIIPVGAQPTDGTQWRDRLGDGA